MKSSVSRINAARPSVSPTPSVTTTHVHGYRLERSRIRRCVRPGMLCGVMLFGLLLAACGGGGGSTSTNLRPATTEDLPVHLVPPSNADVTVANPTAQDPLDHWWRTEPARHALGYASGGAISRFRALQAANPAGVNDSHTRLRAVPSGVMEPLGKLDGITIGQWLDGPAGTLDMDLNWELVPPSVGPEVRATLERAAKLWSRQFHDHFNPSGKLTTNEGPVFTLDPAIADAHVMMNHVPAGAGDTAGYWITNYDSNFNPRPNPDDFEPWVGSYNLGGGTLDIQRRVGDYWLTHTAIHEFGHIFGHNFYEEEYSRHPAVERYLDRENHVWRGPHSMAIYGGPVPMQYLDADLRPTRPGRGSRDISHWGPCDSVMSYQLGVCPEARHKVTITSLDRAFMRDIGYDLVDAHTVDDPEVYGYGAWAEYSAWGVGVERIVGIIDRPGHDTAFQDVLQTSADAFGQVSVAGLHASLAATGTARWSGVLLGVDLRQAELPPVFGVAALTVQLETLLGEAHFSDLQVATHGVLRAFRSPDLTYAVSIEGNRFMDPSGFLDGRFYGPQHEEMAGTLHDRTQDLLAGFGGVRP